MSKADQTQLAIQAIQVLQTRLYTGDLDEAEKIGDKLFMKLTDVVVARYCLKIVAPVVNESGRLRQVVAFFRKYISADIDPMLLLITDLSIPDPFIKQYFTNSGTWNFVRAAVEVASFYQTELLSHVMNRVSLFFRDGNNPQVLKSLLEMESIIQNDRMVEYLNYRLREHSDLAPIPDWVALTEVPPSSQELVDQLPDPMSVTRIKPEDLTVMRREDIIRMLTTDHLDRLNLVDVKNDYAQLTARIIAKLTFAEMSELKTMLAEYIVSSYREHMSDDMSVFQIMGPVNVRADAELSTDYICNNFGGCRMLACTCFDDTTSNDYGEPDTYHATHAEAREWFTGTCRQCELRIASYHHAIRLPLLTGGWFGCYCSSKCVIENLTLTVDDHDLHPTYEIMIAEVESQLNNHQIFDRDNDTSSRVLRVVLLDNVEAEDLANESDQSE